MSRRTQYLTNAEISAFCQQIAMILQAGLPTYYGISILCDDAPDEQTQKLLLQLYKPMEEGSTLYTAMETTQVFPPYMVHMVQLGEETGRLEEVLLSLASYYEREDSIRANIKGAVTYPLILSTMMIAVILVMLAKVLPAFSQIYAELGSELTGFSRTLMTISNALNSYLIVILLAIAALFVAAFIFFHTEIGKVFYQGLALSMTIASSRFANCMFLSLSSGLDTDRGLELAGQLVNNPHMQLKIDKCKEHISHGSNFAEALLQSGIFSKMYSSWISIGYKTGAMDEIMQRICNAYETETDERINRFISILEPALVIMLCLFIGMILVSFLLPLIGIMSSIG